MPSYEQSKESKLWSVRFRETHPDGSEHQKRLSGFATKKAAQYGYEEYMQKKALEPTPEEITQMPEDMLFDVLVSSYLQYEQARVKPSSFYEIQGRINRRILPHFKGEKIKDIKPIDILNWQNKMSEEFSYAYTSHLVTLMTALYRYGEKYHDIKNIMVKVDKPRNTEAKKEMDFWTLEEFRAFRNCIEDPTYKMFFTVLYIIGCRRGEAEALSWEDIDFKKSEIKINKSLTRKSQNSPWEITTPKNSSSNRTVSIPPALKNELKEYKEWQNKECKNPQFVFGGDGPLASRTTDRFFANVCENAFVKKIRIHDLRHSCASLLISKGVSIVAVSKLLGHADVHMTLNTYAHMMADDKSKMLRELQNALDS